MKEKKISLCWAGLVMAIFWVAVVYIYLAQGSPVDTANFGLEGRCNNHNECPFVLEKSGPPEQMTFIFGYYDAGGIAGADPDQIEMRKFAHRKQDIPALAARMMMGAIDNSFDYSNVSCVVFVSDESGEYCLKINGKWKVK